MPVTPVTSNLLSEYYADLGTYTDSGRTTTATTDGASVNGWADQSGNGNHISSVGGASLLKLVNGRWVIRFNGTSNGFTGASVTANEQAATIFVVCRTTKRSGTAVPAAINQGTSRAFLIQENIGRLSAFALGNNVSRIPSSLKYNWAPCDYNLLTVASRSTGVETRVNGHSDSLAAYSSFSITGGTVFVGRNPFAAQDFFKGDILAVLTYGELTSSQVTQVESFLTTRFGLVEIPPAPQSVYVLTGDSIQYGYTATTNTTSHADQVVASVTDRTLNLRNLAVPSAYPLNRDDTYINSFYNSSRRDNILSIWVGTNPLFGGNTPASVYGQVKADAALFKAVGWKVIVVTCLPRTGISEVNRSAFNDAFRADFNGVTADPLVFSPTVGTTYADRMLDFGAHPVLGIAGANTNTANFPDQLHPGDLGQAYLVASELAAVHQLLNLNPTFRRRIGGRSGSRGT